VGCPNYFGQFAFFGLHNGIGPPSGAGIIGAATATYVQTKPTIRNNILIARFMDVLLACGSPGSGNPHGAHYKGILEFSKRTFL
jgi:hypothetical protein